MTHGLTWNFNYTYARSIDIGSNAERGSLFEGFGFGSQVINAFSPGQLRGVSDFDTTHQLNTSWVYELPVGRGRKFGANWSRACDAVLGGWAWSGLARWTSGFPFSVGNRFDFPTNWELTGNAVLNGLPTIDTSGSFGSYANTLTRPRVMEFALRYSF